MTLDDKNEILKNLVGGIKIFTGYLATAGVYEEYSYLALLNTDKTKHGIDSMTMDQLIRAAHKLKMAQWIRLTDICTNIIGEDVWFNKKHQFTVQAVAISEDGTTVYMTDGTSYSDKNLWIKDKR